MPQLGRVLIQLANISGNNTTYKCLLPTSNGNMEIPALSGRNITCLSNDYFIEANKTISQFDFKVGPPTAKNVGYYPATKSECRRYGGEITGIIRLGMSQRDIAEQIKSLYDMEISPELVSSTHPA